MASSFGNIRSKLVEFLGPSSGLLILHPYYPQNALVQNYVPNSMSAKVLVSTILAAFTFICLGTWYSLGYYKKSLSTTSKLTASWFVLCGLLHVVFEGYFVWKADKLASDQSILGQLWKEYALSDSRYLVQDTQILVLETVATFVLGPLCFLAAFDTVQGIPRSAITQTIAAAMHLYGATIYYATGLLGLSKGVSYSRPEPLYFWVYFVAFNAPWIIVPASLIYKNALAIKPTAAPSSSTKKRK